MSLLKSLKECKAENIHLEDDLENSALVLDLGMRGKEYFVEGSQLPEQQSIALLHEIIHDLPKYRGRSTMDNRDESVENEIEILANEIYVNRPVIRRYIERQLAIVRERDGYLPF